MVLYVYDLIFSLLDWSKLNKNITRTKAISVEIVLIILTLDPGPRIVPE